MGSGRTTRWTLKTKMHNDKTNCAGIDKSFSHLLICQANIQHSKVASIELNKHAYPLVLIQEPYLNPKTKSVAFLDTSAGEIHQAQGSNPRACIRVDKRLRPWTVPRFTSRDMCTVAITLEDVLYYVCSLYLDIKTDPVSDDLTKLERFCHGNGVPLIVGMDSNAHSLLWGSKDTNQRGETLESFILEKGFIVLNEGNTPTFSGGVGNSVIDITLMNTKAYQLLPVVSWKVSSKRSFSDHRYIEIGVEGNSQEEPEFRNVRKTDWHLFREKLGTHGLAEVEILRSRESVDEAGKLLQRAISEAFDQACPLKKALKRKPNPWWNEELESLRNQIRGHGVDEETRRDLIKEYRIKIDKAKQTSWRQFCTKAESTKEVADLIKKAAGPKFGRRSILRTPEGEMKATPKETVELLMSTHFPGSVTGRARRQRTTLAQCDYDDATLNSDVVKYITFQKVKAALATFGPYKASGPDGFRPLLLQHLTDDAVSLLTRLYQYSLAIGHTPEVWRKMDVVFIPKPGKDDYGIAKAWRPITLSNFLLKALERIMQWYINEQVLEYTPLKAQHAYTVGYSTETALSEAFDRIESAVLRKEKALAVSLDCSGAFDTIRFDSARRAMETRAVPEMIIKWYEQILEERTVEAELQGTRSTRKPTRGSPQGGVLSPLVWNLIMDTLISNFGMSSVNIVAYADDVLLIVVGKDRHTMARLMQTALDKVMEWGDANGLVFNPSKTQTVMFTRSRKIELDPPLVIKGKQLEYSDTMTYLGVTLQKRLSFTHHIQSKLKTTRKLLNITRSVVGQRWGLSPQKLLWVYTAIARPIISYGALIWAKYMTGKDKEGFRRLQRAILLAISNTMRSTPTQGMEVALGLLPLTLHVESEAIKARARTRPLVKERWDGVGDRLHTRGHRRHLDETLRRLWDASTPVDRTLRRLNWVRNDDFDREDLTVYTDGSKEAGRTGFGWAACVEDTVIAEDNGYLGTEATVFQAEVFAIQAALMWLISNPHKLKHVHRVRIRSDSSSAIAAIYGCHVESTVVLECARTLKTAQEQFKVNLSWIRGHAGSTGNEFADALAKAGTRRDDGDRLPIPMPRSHIKMLIEKSVEKKWQEIWSNTVDCKISRLFCPIVDMKGWKKNILLSRRRIRKLFQVVTGHGPFGRHLAKWKTNVQARCSFCAKAEETSWHLWSDCPALELQRRQILSRPNDDRSNKILLFFEEPNIDSQMNTRFEETAIAVDEDL